MPCQNDGVPTQCRVKTMTCRYDIVSKRCRVNTVSCQHDTLSKTVSHHNDVVPTWRCVNTTPCQHEVVSKRIHVNTIPYQDGAESTRRRVNAMSFRYDIVPPHEALSRWRRAKTTLCQYDDVPTQHRVKTTPFQKRRCVNSKYIVSI